MVTSSYTEILEKLISYDTTSRNSNLELIGYVQDYLKGYGIASELVPNEDGQKASLFATVGPKGIGGIGLSGHTDVVPVDGQAWSTDPFSIVEKDGLIYGRGTCDMKGYLACVLAAVPDFVSRDLKIPFHLLFSYDEEIGCVGVRPMIAELGDRLIQPRMVIVGEPTDMTVVDAHKGILAYVTTVRGLESHSSLPDNGVNAVSYASKLVVELDRLGRIARETNTDDRFRPPFSSVHVGRIDGGTALNIVPKECRIVWEIRYLPGFDVSNILEEFESYAASLREEMQAVYPNASIETVQSIHLPSFQVTDSSVGDEVTALALRCAEQNDVFAVSYGTEAGLFEIGGCPTIVCGPGNIAQAHAPDEYVAVNQMDKCMAFLKRLADYAER